MSRRRKLTDEQVDAILEWHRNRKTQRQLARELGVAKHLVASAISRKGVYKSASPENWEKNMRERHVKFERLRLRALL